MGDYVLGFDEIDRTQGALVGGKGAALGELARIDGIAVPAGVCVTTAAYRRVLADASIDERLDALARVHADDRAAIAALSAAIRAAIEGVAIPADLAAAITDAVTTLGAAHAYAVRSSATAEDLPTASFAGQQDSYLNVVGTAAILEHVRRCWASLFTERAVAYRIRNGFEHRRVHMAVVVQRMVEPHAAGVLFTADPISGNRTLASIEATFGLGEALVSGEVNPDAFTVRGDAVVSRSIAASAPTLTDAQIVRLAALGRRIETHFGAPQDIEWCLADGDFQFVQSRPITTLFPVPETADDANRVWVSVGHQQMMTDPMTPLGLSFWQLTTPRPMGEAAGRLFVEVTNWLGTPTSRAGFLDLMGKGDPLIRDALQTLVDRGDFIPELPDSAAPALPVGTAPATVATDAAIVAELIAESRDEIATVQREIADKTGPEVLEYIIADLTGLQRTLMNPRSYQVILAGFQATWWLNEKLEEWLGEKNAADVLAQSVPNNVTSEMGLALLDVADAIRPHPEAVALLERVRGDDVLEALPNVSGGAEAREAITAWLEKYGVRAVGEIDITRPRWSEHPSMLVPLILSNVRNFAPGVAAQRFEQGKQEAARKEREILERLRALPNGNEKAAEAKRMIDRLRTFAGYREYPKYGKVRRYFVYKQALMAEARRLVQGGVLGEVEDAFFLRLPELLEVSRTQVVDAQLIRERREAFRVYQSLTPPRVLTSDGEGLNGDYRRTDVPAGALVGLAVSAGTVEGRARVLLDIAEADLEPGDILVTAFTDPSWTPLFVTIAGLVTQVGGKTTHGAVIAREYGLPAVVGVANATTLIRDGQRIRLHGSEGYIELLD